jgi:hypothetical protein
MNYIKTYAELIKNQEYTKAENFGNETLKNDLKYEEMISGHTFPRYSFKIPMLQLKLRLLDHPITLKKTDDQSRTEIDYTLLRKKYRRMTRLQHSQNLSD